MNNTLFVLHRIGIGGSMTSMLNLLEFLKKRGCEADLFLMEHDGIFLDRAKKAANLLKEDIVLSAILCNKQKLIKKRNIIKLSIRLLYVAAHKIFGYKTVNKYVYLWRCRQFHGKYKNVIAFQESLPTEFAQYICASNRVAWVHNDYCRIIEDNSDEDMQKTYDRFHHIICVSRSSMESMIANINGIKSRTAIIYNTFNIVNIQKLSKERIVPLKKSKLVFVSIGRFTQVKRFDRVLDVSTRLLDEGYDFRWYVIGDGKTFNDIKNSISEKQLENNVILMGALRNPYPVIRSADYLVITSLYEAQPMVAIEALILHKPVISTEFSSVHEVINNSTGIICENSTNGLYSGLKRVLDDSELRKSLSLGANTFRYDNDTIVHQVLEVLK